MPAPLTIAVPDNLLAPLEAARLRLAQPDCVVLRPAPLPVEARQSARWCRLLDARRRGHGAAAAIAGGAEFRSPSVRALLTALDLRADAVVLEDAPADAFAPWAWRALEPRPGARRCGDLWMAALPPENAPESAPTLAWFDWPAREELSPAIDAFVASAGFLARIAAAPALPVLVRFAGGPNPLEPALDRFAPMLAARAGAGGVAPAADVALYSPFCYPAGRFDLTAFRGALERALQESGVGASGALPLLCVPRLDRAEFAAAIADAGGYWAGPFRAGAEVPAARVRAGDPPAALTATLAWLARAAGVTA